MNTFLEKRKSRSNGITARTVPKSAVKKRGHHKRSRHGASTRRTDLQILGYHCLYKKHIQFKNLVICINKTEVLAIEPTSGQPMSVG